MRTLVKIVLYGEDEREEISIKEAVALLGNDKVRDIYLNQDGRGYYIDSDYLIKFVWGK